MKKTIAFYVESMVIGGAEKVLIDLVNHMDSEKYSITVISIFKSSIYSDYTFQFDSFFKPHITYKWLIDNTKWLNYRMFNYAFAHGKGEKLYHKYIKEKYDIEVAFYEGMPTAFLAHSDNVASKKIAWLHTDNHRLYCKKTPSQLQVIRSIYENYDKIVGVSESVAKSFLNFFPGMPVTYMHNLVDEQAIINKTSEKQIPRAEGSVRFLTVGRMIPVKGYDRFLYSLKRLHDEGFKVEAQMIGDGSSVFDIQRIIRENNMEDYVQLLGIQNNPYVYMKSADYLVCSSLAEGLSTVIIEALVCMLPVLTTDCAGMREIFGEHECGIIAENTNQGIYNMMKMVLVCPELHQRFVSQERIRRDYFSIRERMKAYDLLFEG